MSIYYSDLQWVAQNNDIADLKSKQHNLLTPNLTLLDSLGVHELDQFMSHKNTYMLGTYYEALWEFLLEAHPQTELVAKNIQINDHFKKTNPTIGEMDFIYWHNSLKKYVHLEVAIKFYLDIEQKINDSPYSQWVGPKCNDRLDLKFNKLMHHQTQLIELESTKFKIQDLIKDEKIISRAVLQGRLFRKYKDEFNLTENYWFTLSDFKKWFEFAQTQYHISVLQKPHWLSLAQYDEVDNQTWISIADVIECVDAQSFALPFVLKHKTQLTNTMIFIAPEHWPTLINKTSK